MLHADRTLSDASIETGRHTAIIVQRPRLPATTRPFATYLPRSVLLLPRVDEPHPWAPVVALLRFLGEHLDHGAVIVGHRDASEPDAFAPLRAEALRCFLADDEQSWVDIATSHGRVQDTQVFLEYLHRTRAWDTHVPEITDTADDTTARAVDQFQRTYNLAFHREIFENGIIGEPTLGAIFEVAKAEFVHWMEKAGVSLDMLSFFADDRPTLAADPKFEGQRWVELVAIQRGEPYDLAREPTGAGIYEIARRTPLPSEEIEAPAYGMLRVRLIDEWGHSLAGRPYTLRVGDDERVGETDERGMLAEAMLPQGVPVLRVDGGRPVLFHDRYQPRRVLPPTTETEDFDYLQDLLEAEGDDWEPLDDEDDVSLGHLESQENE